jgi:hypothetical protein
MEETTMNIFQKISDYLTGSSQPAPNYRRNEIDELSQIPPMSEEEADAWGDELGEDDIADLESMTQIMNEFNDTTKAAKFAAIVRYLNRKYPSQPLFYHFEAAKRAVAPLTSRFAGYDQPEWTEVELDQWIDTLDDHYLPQVLDKIRQYKAAGLPDGPKLVKFLSDIRRNVEKNQEEDAEAEAANRLTPLRAWAIWMDVRRQNAELNYFERENRNARGH